MYQGDQIPEPSGNVFYSIYSWFSILVMHALLHFWMAGKCKQQNDFEMTNMTNERAGTGFSAAKQKALDSFSERELHQSASSFDGNEPPIFYELLSQTGSEMTTVRAQRSSLLANRHIFDTYTNHLMIGLVPDIFSRKSCSRAATVTVRLVH